MTENVVCIAFGGCLFGLLLWFCFVFSLVQETLECAHARIYGVLGTQSPLLGVMVQMPKPKWKSCSEHPLVTTQSHALCFIDSLLRCWLRGGDFMEKLSSSSGFLKQLEPGNIFLLAGGLDWWSLLAWVFAYPAELHALEWGQGCGAVPFLSDGAMAENEIPASPVHFVLLGSAFWRR